MQLRELMTSTVITAARPSGRGTSRSLRGLTAEVIEGALPHFFFHERG